MPVINAVFIESLKRTDSYTRDSIAPRPGPQRPYYGGDFSDEVRRPRPDRVSFGRQHQENVPCSSTGCQLAAGRGWAPPPAPAKRAPDSRVHKARLAPRPGPRSAAIGRIRPLWAGSQGPRTAGPAARAGGALASVATRSFGTRRRTWRSFPQPAPALPRNRPPLPGR